MFVENPCPLLLLGWQSPARDLLIGSGYAFICVASSRVDWADGHHLRELSLQSRKRGTEQRQKVYECGMGTQATSRSLHPLSHTRCHKKGKQHDQ